MSERPTDGLPDGMESPARRAASVTLTREGEDPASTAALMDPANQSLAEALRITFHLLQLAMIVIGALFALSGFRSVREGEVGVRLLFGRASGGELPPGFQPSAPYPFGDMVKVQTAGRPVILDTEFWPYVQSGNRDMPIDRLPSYNHLKPGQDGSMITGDSNIAHSRWRATFRRSNALAWAQNMPPEQEEKILRGVISRGIVQAVASTSIDRLLKQSSDEGSLAAQAKEAAQQMLDSINSGIEIERLYLDDKVPPLSVRPKFIAVESAASNAGKTREDAEGEAAERLSSVAGEAAPVLIELIERHELAIEQGDEARASEILATIHAIFDGEPAVVDGEPVQARVAGEVSRVISEARLHASREVSERRAEYSLFRARLDQFNKNPELTIRQAWTEAYAALQGRDMVQTLTVPPGARGVEVVLNQDPAIMKDLDRAQKLRLTTQQEEERKRAQQKDKYQTETGLRPSTD